MRLPRPRMCRSGAAAAPGRQPHSLVHGWTLQPAVARRGWPRTHAAARRQSPRAGGHAQPDAWPFPAARAAGRDRPGRSPAERPVRRLRCCRSAPAPGLAVTWSPTFARTSRMRPRASGRTWARRPSIGCTEPVTRSETASGSDVDGGHANPKPLLDVWSDLDVVLRGVVIVVIRRGVGRGLQPAAPPTQGRRVPRPPPSFDHRRPPRGRRAINPRANTCIFMAGPFRPPARDPRRPEPVRFRRQCAPVVSRSIDVAR